MSIKASIRSAGTKVTANTVGIIPVLNGNTTLNGALSINGNLAVDTDTFFVNSTNNRVGIGITNPSQALGVKGDIALSANSAINEPGNLLFSGMVHNANGNVTLGGSDDTKALHIFNNSGVDAIRVDRTNSRVGIGNYSEAGLNRAPRETLEVGGKILADSLTLVNSPTGAELRVRSKGTDADPAYDNIRIEGSDSILKAGQFKVHKVVYDPTGVQEIQNNYQFSYTTGSTDVYTFNNLSHGDGTAAGPVRIDSKGANAEFNLEGLGGYGSASSVARIKATDGPATVIIQTSGVGSASVETRTDAGTIFKTTASDHSYQTGTIQLGTTNAFQIARTFDGSNYSHSITATNLSFGPFECTGEISASSVAASSASFNTISGTLTTAAQANITSVGTLTTLNVTSDGSSDGTVTADALNVSGFLVGSGGAGVSYGGSAFSVDVSGQLTASHSITTPTGTFTSVGGTLTTAAQTNITNVGVLVGLTLDGNLSTNSNIELDSGGILNFSSETNGSIIGNCDININGSITASNSAGIAQLKASGAVAQLILEDSDQSSEGTITNTGGDLYYTAEGAGTDYGNHIFMCDSATNAAKPAIMQLKGVEENVDIKGYISVTRGGNTYDNAPKIQLIDSDGTNQIGEVACSGGNLQLVSRNNTGKGIISFIQDDGTDRITAMKISSGGKVGIGLHPDNNVLEDFHVGGSARIDGDFFGNIGSNTFAVKSSTNNVGIGTSNPDASKKLAVLGNSKFVGSVTVSEGIQGTAAAPKTLEKHYCSSDNGALRLFRTNAATNSVTMKYESASSNQFTITQTGTANDEIRISTDKTRFFSNVEVGNSGTGQNGRRSLKIRDGRDDTQGLMFTHENANQTVQMGMFGISSHVDHGKFKITHKHDTNASTVVLETAKQTGNVTIYKPTKITQPLNLQGIPICADENDASASGLQAGDVYRTSTGELRIKLP